jgi:hypothetical protein
MSTLPKTNAAFMAALFGDHVRQKPTNTRSDLTPFMEGAFAALTASIWATMRKAFYRDYAATQKNVQKIDDLEKGA